MRTFKVFARWLVTGTLEIEAASLRQAVQKAYDQSTHLPPGDPYIDFFEVDTEITQELNEWEDEDGSEPRQSTYCGSMTEDELRDHVKDCAICREDFLEYFEAEEEQDEQP